MSTLTAPRFRVTHPLCWLGTLYLRLFGWTIEGKLPPDRKWIGIVAPHTSNWDFAHTLAVSFHLRVAAYWIGKHTLFRGPFGWLLRRFGGVPVDRQSSRNYVDQAVQAFNERDELVLGIAPAGTRKRTDKWKSGFYYIARGARVRIVLVSLEIREFYADVQPKYPDKKSNIEIVSTGKSDE